MEKTKTKTKQSKFCRHTFFAPVNRLFFRLFFVVVHKPRTYFSGGEKRQPKILLVSEATEKSTAFSMIQIPKL